MTTEILAADEENLIRAGEMIRAGELVAFPTETVYGLGADGLNEDACRKIYLAKGRPSTKPLTMHVASFAQIEELAEISSAAEKLIAAFLPGPLTLILPKKKIVPEFVTCGAKSVGIRFPANSVAQALIKISGRAIAAPSANISGKPAPKTAREVFENLGGRIPLILDGGECAVGYSSTIIDLTAAPKILRRGKISAAALEEILGGEVLE